MEKKKPFDNVVENIIGKEVQTFPVKSAIKFSRGADYFDKYTNEKE